MLSRTLLLIEDDRDIQDALRESLELEGYEVHVASDGGEGLQKLDAGLTPALILLDLMMPGMDGKEFLSRIRATRHSALPVIVLTASQEPLPPGALKLVRKPFSLDALIYQIEAILRRRAPALHSVAMEAVSAEAL